MTTPSIRSVIIERDLTHPPERIWRALTQPHLLEEWLMATDFAPTVGHHFGLQAGWGRIECEVLEIEHERLLAYSWTALGLESTVTFKLTPLAHGTRLRMEQAGFRPDQEEAYQGARLGWRRFLAKLDQLLARGQDQKGEHNE